MDDADTSSRAPEPAVAGRINTVLGLSDRDIIERIRAGDEALFSQCFHAYWESLCRAALYVTRDTDEAREIVAKVFAVLWERRAGWHVSTTVEAYLFGAVRNEARHVRRDALRRSGLLKDHTQHDPREASLYGRPIHHDRGATEATDLELTLDQTVRELPDRYQLAIYLRWRRGMEYAEIGEVLGIGADAVRKIITRALGMLRRQLREL